MDVRLSALGLAAAGLLIAAPAPSTAQNPAKLYVGALSCNVSGGGGFVFEATKEMSCVFLTTEGKSALYRGAIHRYGINIGDTKRSHTVFHVFTLGSERAAGAIAGTYAGTQESVGVGVGGGGGNVLIGGRDRPFIQQSATVEQNAGFNFAEGLAEMSLTPG
jgi:hypothetical protein